MTTIEQEHDPAAILAPYTDGVAQLEAAIPGLTESDLDIAQAASVWTIRQIVHHVIDGDDLWKVCIKAALGHSEGIFSLQWYCEKPQDKWVESWDDADRAIESFTDVVPCQSPSHRCL